MGQDALNAHYWVGAELMMRLNGRYGVTTCDVTCGSVIGRDVTGWYVAPTSGAIIASDVGAEIVDPAARRKMI